MIELDFKSVLVGVFGAIIMAHVLMAGGEYAYSVQSARESLEAEEEKQRGIEQRTSFQERSRLPPDTPVQIIDKTAPEENGAGDEIQSH